MNKEFLWKSLIYTHCCKTLLSPCWESEAPTGLIWIQSQGGWTILSFKHLSWCRHNKNLENNCMRYVCRPGKNAGDKLLHQMTGKKSLEGDQVLYPMLNVAEWFAGTQKEGIQGWYWPQNCFSHSIHVLFQIIELFFVDFPFLASYFTQQTEPFS
jgi:hypothetical protein